MKRRLQTAIFLLAAGLVLGAPVRGAGVRRYPEGSAEHAAMGAAAKFLENSKFSLREEYWSGDLSATAGKAIRLQFFPHTTYRLFLAAPPAQAPEGTKVHLNILDRDARVVAEASSKFKSMVAVAKFVPEKTGLYMVLMRLEAPAGTPADFALPCALFYGYE